MYAICSSYQQVLLWGNPPHFKTLGAIVLVSIVLLAAGMLLFRKASPDMVDVL
jgi:lipopolysaccharide transport system permease protein